MEAYSLHLSDAYNSTHRQRLGSSRTENQGKKIKKRKKPKNFSFFVCETVVMPAKPTKSAKGSVREGEGGKKAKVTQTREVQAVCV